MINKQDLETLAETRLGDAQHLFQEARYSAAYYLAGYAVELGIKACIASLFLANVIPDKTLVASVYSHKLDELLGLAGVKRQFLEEMKGDAALAAAWGVASKWTETSRYEIWDQFAAANMIDAVGHQDHGVLQWLKTRW